MGNSAIKFMEKEGTIMRNIVRNRRAAAAGLLFLAALLNTSGCTGAQKAEIFLAEEGDPGTEKEAGEPAAETVSPTPGEVTPETEDQEENVSPEKEEKQPEEIFVDVCGAVAKPGVYGMPPESRVFQAIEMAGGFLPDAAGSYINQAQPLDDGQQIYIPTKEEAEEKALTVPGAEASDTAKEPVAGGNEQGKVNLNTADSAALQTLNGIGEAKAEAILAYREEHGAFSAIEEIMNVPGIKESTFSNIKDKIAVE